MLLVVSLILVPTCPQVSQRYVTMAAHTQRHAPVHVKTVVAANIWLFFREHHCGACNIEAPSKNEPMWTTPYMSLRYQKAEWPLQHRDEVLTFEFRWRFHSHKPRNALYELVQWFQRKSHLKLKMDYGQTWSYNGQRL